MLGQSIQPIGAGINAGDLAVKLQQHWDQDLRDMAGSEDRDGPRLPTVVFKKEFDLSSARHPNISLQVPGHKLIGDAIVCGKLLLCMLNGGGFDFAPAHGTGIDSRGGDDRLGTDDLRGAAANLDQRHGRKGHPDLDQLVKLAAMLHDVERHEAML